MKAKIKTKGVAPFNRMATHWTVFNYDELVEEYIRNFPKRTLKCRKFDVAEFRALFPGKDDNFIFETVSAVDNILLNGIQLPVVWCGPELVSEGITAQHFMHIFGLSPSKTLDLVLLIKHKLDTLEPTERSSQP